MAKRPPQDFLDASAAKLDRAWGETDSRDRWQANLPQPIQDAVQRSINSRTKTYRYVLPTQILAKCVNSALDCRVVQEGSGLAGAFDARTLCHNVVVPFDRANHNVLGGAPEPYVNNPLRIPSITPDKLAAQRDKDGFDDLCSVLEYAQDKLLGARAAGITELLFVASGDVAQSNAQLLRELIDREFITGQNVYSVSFDRLLETCLILFSETGRRNFFILIGECLDELKADLIHRQSWRDLLESV